MVDYRAIGRRIGLKRKKIGMTQAHLAEELNISDSYMSQIERGNAKVSLSRLYQIADVLNVDIALLVSDCTLLENTEMNSEIEQIIHDWAPDKRSLLIDLIICADNKMKSN